MVLKFNCRCGERLTAPESAAGKRGKCPRCGDRLKVPAPQAAATSPNYEEAKHFFEPKPDSLHLDDRLAIFNSKFGELRDEALNETDQAAPESAANETPAKSNASHGNPLRAIARAFKSFAAAAVAPPAPGPHNTCYQCEGLGLRFSPINGKQSTCEWCNGTGVVERYQSDTAGEIVDRSFLPKNMGQRGRRRG